VYQVRCEFEFSYGHRLLQHAGRCRHLHGHNARVVVVLEAERIDSAAMVADFSEVKKLLSDWVGQNLDHRMILQRGDPAVGPLSALGEPLFLTEQSPTAELLAKLIYDAAADKGLPVKCVELWETSANCAVYCP